MWLAPSTPREVPMLDLVEDVVELLALGLEVAVVVAVGLHLKRHALGDLEPEAPEAHHLRQVVGQEPDALEAEVLEDLGPDAVVPEVGGEAELLVGLDGVHALVLEVVGLHLVEEPDAAALLLHVDDDPLALAGQKLHGRLELLAAVAAQRVERVAGEAGGVHAHQHVLLALGLAHDERDRKSTRLNSSHANISYAVFCLK